MAKSFMIHACLIFLTFCPGKGTNRWKKVIHNYKRDFGPEKRIFELHQYEMEDYDDYISAQEEHSYHEYGLDDSSYDYEYDDENSVNNAPLKETNKNSDTKHYFNTTKKSKSSKIPLINDAKNKIINISTSDKWPKFEDILLSIGRRYDWKNDRWIKVKKKKGIVDTQQNVNKSINFHEKHRFIYRIVKLNRPKSKRNIVLAVTAVR